MKNLFLLAVAVLLVNTAFAQDILHFNDGRTYKAKIIEITDIKVRFKKITDTKDKVYSVGKKKLAKVVYETGKTVSFIENQPEKGSQETESDSSTKVSDSSSTDEDTKITAADAIPENIKLEVRDTTNEGHLAKFIKNSFSLGPRIALPMADLANEIEVGLGGIVSFDLSINEKFAFTSAFGFTKHNYSPDTLFAGSALLTPMQAGIKYYFGDNHEGMFIEIAAGIQKIRNNLDAVTDPTTGNILTYYNKSNSFTFAPVFGYKTHGASLRVAYEFIPHKSKDYSYLSFSLLIDVLNSRKPGELKAAPAAH